jgi:glycerophosphoryl diester phosphodiesterase
MLEILKEKRRPLVMAHRGNSALAPENTLTAFRQAIHEGADIIETDLHVTLDGRFVCIHDATVDRTTDGTGFVRGQTLLELKRLNAAHRHKGSPEERIPTLEEFAGLVPVDVALALELKSEWFAKPQTCRELVALLDRCGVRDRTIALSFQPRHIRMIHAIAPEIPCGILSVTHPWPHSGFQVLGPYWPLLLINPVYVRSAHRRGQLVCPMDPSPDSRLTYYDWLGCDAVLTNNPGATRHKLAGREGPVDRS